MRTLTWTAFIVAAIISAAYSSAAFAFTNFHFIRDTGNDNQLQAHAGTFYDDQVANPHEEDEDLDDSDVETDEAEALASLNDDHALSTATAQTAIVAYGGPAMSISGAIQSQFIVEGEDDLFVGAVGGALGLSTPYNFCDPLDYAEYYGKVASNIYPNGTNCTISGSATMSWSYTGDSDLLDPAVRGGTIIVYVGNTIVAKIVGGPGSAWVVNGPFDMGHSESTDEFSDSVTVEFSVTGQVGSRVTVLHVLEDIYYDANEPGDMIQDDINFQVDIAVN